jgi:hypothetical protein
MAEGLTGSGLLGIKLDTAELRDTAAVLREVSWGFEVDDNLLAIALEGIGSRGASGRLRGAGIGRLEQALTAFSGQWRVRREAVRGHLEQLASIAALVADNFDSAEQSLAGVTTPVVAHDRRDTRGRVPDSGWR